MNTKRKRQTYLMFNISLSFLLIQLRGLCIISLAYVHLRNDALLKRLLAQRNRLLKTEKKTIVSVIAETWVDLVSEGSNRPLVGECD